MDGASTDGTLAILKKFDHLIWASEADQGQSDAMNKGFKMSGGDIIVYLNADDWFEKGVFNGVVKAFEENSIADMVVGDLIRVLPDKQIYYDNYSLSLMEILDSWKIRFPQNPVSYFYKRSLQEKIGEFPLNNHMTMDYWFLLRAYRIANIKKLNSLTGYFYVDGNNKSSDVQESLDSLDRTAKEFLRAYPVVRFQYLMKRLKRRFGL